jgi:outer membrane protein TolC
VKNYFIPILFFISGLSIGAQHRDLNFYLNQAKMNSPLINKTKNDNEIVKLDLQQVRSILSKPEVNIVSGIMFAPIVSHDNNSNRIEWVSNGAVNYTGHDLALSDGGQYQALVSVNQPLLAGTKLKRYENKAAISGQINDNNIELTVHELEQVIAYQYILCLKSKMEISNSLLLLKDLDEHLKILEKLVENAIYKQTDLILLQLEIQNYEAEYKTFQSEYEAGLYDLNLICGIRDTVLIEPEEIELILETADVSNSKFSTAYRLDSLNIIAEQVLSELKYKPQLDLFANAGLNAVYLPAFNRLGFSTGITLTWNIFDGRQRDIQREKSNVNLQTVEFEKKTILAQNEISKKKVLGQINSIDGRIVLNEAQTDQYNKLYEAYSRELSQGEASVMDFKNLLKDISAKKQENIMLRMEKQLLINTYNYLNY